MELSLYEKVRSGIDLNDLDIKTVIKVLKKIHQRGGVVAISEDDTLITTYRLDSYKR